MDTVEVYVNGFSTSLPEDIQYRALRSVSGFENVKFFRPGYAIGDYSLPPSYKQFRDQAGLVVFRRTNQRYDWL